MLAATLLVVAAARLPAQATGGIDGIVMRGGQSGAPLSPAAGAEVQLSAVDVTMMNSAFATRFPPVRANDSGSFAYRGLTAGIYRLSVRLVGHVSSVVDVTVMENGTARPTIVLALLTPQLERVVTTANRTHLARMLELRGFNERRRQGWGHFLDPDRLARSGATSVLSELKPYLRGCMIMYLDGVPATIPRTLQPRDVAAIEIYLRNLQAPAGYQNARGDCGSILIWLAPPGDDEPSR